MTEPLRIGDRDIRIDDAVSVARAKRAVAPLSIQAREAMRRSHAWVAETVSKESSTIYGVNTGFGPLAHEAIDPDEARQLSRNVVLACVAGVGDPLPSDVVRAMMLIRAHTLGRGKSGVRPELVDVLTGMLNADVVPVVPAKGSLGASGDLAPLAHIAVVASVGTGDDDASGEAWFRNERMSGERAMAAADLPRIALAAKEGLALTNGTDYMVAAGLLAVHDAGTLLAHAQLAGALSLEAACALSQSLDPVLHKVSEQSGQQAIAARLRNLLAGSRLVDSMPERVQDAYSLRCIPQVLGPFFDILSFLARSFEKAANAISDNPLIVGEGDTQRSLSGGNFHGEGPALWLDVLPIALTQCSSIAERRIFRLLTPELSDGLPSMLVPRPGLNCGLMVAQYTAAALVSDSKTLSHPDSVDSIPSSANQEDFVSMGANAARHCHEVIANVRRVIAIELQVAAQAVELRPDGRARLAPATAAIHSEIRRHVPLLEEDRVLTPDIEALATLIETNRLLELADAVVPPERRSL